jgi:hypothetical protein
MMTMVVICHAHLVGSPFERNLPIIAKLRAAMFQKLAKLNLAGWVKKQRRTSCNKQEGRRL